jgi:hypothetical protein
MHPNALLDHAADLIEQVLSFQHPADATVARYAKEHRQLGPRERHTLADLVYAVLREWPTAAVHLERTAGVRRPPPAVPPWRNQSTRAPSSYGRR